jgi:SAM-dependent methyltransferase
MQRRRGLNCGYSKRVIRLVLTLIAVPLILLQVRKPSRDVGRLFLWAMNRSHSRLTDWGLTHVQVDPKARILDVGCGGGRTIQKLAARAPAGMVCGVDYSAESVTVSRSTNAQLVASGRVDVRQASVTQLPFGDDEFDLVTAVETHYYWPDLHENVREILRVMRPGATFALVAESYKNGKYDRLQRLVMAPLGSTHLSVDEHRDLLVSAGYSNVRVDVDTARGWIAATGQKPLR